MAFNNNDDFAQACVDGPSEQKGPVAVHFGACGAKPFDRSSGTIIIKTKASPVTDHSTRRTASAHAQYTLLPQITHLWLNRDGGETP